MPEDTKGHRLASMFPTPGFFESTNIFTAEQIILKLRDLDAFQVVKEITGSQQFTTDTITGMAFAMTTQLDVNLKDIPTGQVWQLYKFSIAGTLEQGAKGEFEDVALFAGWDHARIDIHGSGAAAFFIVKLYKKVRG